MDINTVMEIRELVNNEEKARKLENYRQQNELAKKGQILFTGSSLMEHFPVSEYWIESGLYEKTGKIAYNRGIAGYTTDEFLQGMDIMLLDLEPEKVFINIGTNDIKEREDGTDWLDHLLVNYDEILRRTKESIDSKVYLMAYYPVCRKVIDQDEYMSVKFRIRSHENIKRANDEVKALADKYGYSYVDANAGLSDADGDLKEELTVEGVHMFSSAYHIVLENLRPYL